MFAVEVGFTNGIQLQFNCRAYGKVDEDHGKSLPMHLQIGDYCFYGVAERVIAFDAIKTLIPVYVKTSRTQAPTHRYSDASADSDEPYTYTHTRRPSRA
jgi:hypothetical protein